MSGLRARLERLGPVRDAAPSRAFSSETKRIVLRRTGRFDLRVAVAARLRESGLSLAAAHRAITELADLDVATVDIPVDGGIKDLGRDLAAMDVAMRAARE
jgi:hypothetical protein